MAADLQLRLFAASVALVPNTRARIKGKHQRAWYRLYGGLWCNAFDSRAATPSMKHLSDSLSPEPQVAKRRGREWGKKRAFGYNVYEK
eukprot:542202-Rhodomonas_salina.1